METNNLFIVEGSPLSSVRFVSYLEEKMGRSLTLFSNADKALRHINKNTKLVILDCSVEEKKANVLQGEIKKINQATEVIRLLVPGSSKHVGIASGLFFKKSITLKELNAFVSKMVNYPAKILIEKLGVNKLLAVLLSHFIFIGVVYSIFILIIISLSQIAILMPTL